MHMFYFGISSKRILLSYLIVNIYLALMSYLKNLKSLAF